MVAVSLSCLTARGDQPKAVANAKLRAVPEVKWDAVFDRTSGWTGADVVGTVDLGQGRVLWLFGDTWIGEVAEGAHVPGSRMVNNSVGLHGGDLPQDGRSASAVRDAIPLGPKRRRGASDRLDRS